MEPVTLTVRMVEHVSEATTLTAPVPMDTPELTVSTTVRICTIMIRMNAFNTNILYT